MSKHPFWGGRRKVPMIHDPLSRKLPRVVVV